MVPFYSFGGNGPCPNKHLVSPSEHGTASASDIDAQSLTITDADLESHVYVIVGNVYSHSALGTQYARRTPTGSYTPGGHNFADGRQTPEGCNAPDGGNTAGRRNTPSGQNTPGGHNAISERHTHPEDVHSVFR